LLTMRAIIRALIRPPDEPQQPDAPQQPEPLDSEGAGDGTAEQKPSAEPSRAGRRAGVAWAVLAVLKTFILFGGLWILLTRGVVDPMPLVVGYGVLPLGITLNALWSSLRSPYR
jgi:hypothetical protein